MAEGLRKREGQDLRMRRPRVRVRNEEGLFAALAFFQVESKRLMRVMREPVTQKSRALTAFRNPTLARL
jgi:PP-loop superfamily ATP-utilizing enzyme